MVSSDFRAEARKKLNGKWGKAACICLAYMVFTFAIGFISGFFSESMQGIISIVTSIIEIPISFGLIISFFKLYNDEEVKAFNFLNFGFNNFKRAWGISLRMLLKMLLPVILMIVAYIIIIIGSTSLLISGSSSTGIIAIIGFILLIVSFIWTIYKSYSYQLSYLIAIDNTEMTCKEVVEKSEEAMNGNRFKLFCLQLSFIGWIILAAIALGIPLLWILPYIQFATIAFYKYVSGNNSDIKTEVIDENNN